jgi:hypothetical protein
MDASLVRVFLPIEERRPDGSDLEFEPRRNLTARTSAGAQPGGSYAWRRAFLTYVVISDNIGRGDRSSDGKADVAKPMHGQGSGVFEIALPFKGDAFRVVYAVQIPDEIWVVHAFRKKSTQGIKTPQREIDLIKDRLKRLKEMLR